MISPTWIERHQPAWRRLEVVLQQAGRDGLKRLPRTELAELGFLYRQVASDLARMRGEPLGQRYEIALNRLLGEAHNLLYAGGRTRGASLWAFFRYEYPQLFRAQRGVVMTAAGVLIVGSLLGWWAAARDPGFAPGILGPQIMASIAKHEMWTQSVVAVRPVASSGIMTNNITVSLTAFAFGITAGLGTLWMLFFNGVMIGTVGAACHAAAMSLALWSFVAPHGVIELPAITIAGAAGLRIAQGLLFPGPWTRRESLRRGGAEGARLAAGVVPMLVVAGTIEGFISPTAIPVGLKFALAAVMFTFLVLYLSSGAQAADAGGKRRA